MLLDSPEKVCLLLGRILGGQDCLAPDDMAISLCVHGYINHVWRVRFKNPLQSLALAHAGAAVHPQLYACSSIIIKSAPSFVKSNPALRISDARLDYEVEAIRQIRHSLERHSGSAIQVAQVYYYDQTSKAVLMEDLGDDLVGIDEWVTWLYESSTAGANAPLQEMGDQFGCRLGTFLQTLHSTVKSVDKNVVTVGFFKDAVYGLCQSWLASAGHSADQLDRLNRLLMQAFDELFVQNGPDSCLTLSDLRDKAFLLKPGSFERLWLIDFEFCGLANPLIDVADATSCFWTAMLCHREQTEFYNAALQSFYESYFKTSANWHTVLVPQKQSLLRIHIAVRLLMSILISDLHCVAGCSYRQRFGTKPIAERITIKPCTCKQAMREQAASLITGTLSLSDLFPFLKN